MISFKKMKSIVYFILIICIIAVCCCFATGCSSSESCLDSEHPITLSLWHIYGKNTDSPMNELVDEFNRTVGREQGVIINVANVPNILEVTSQLSASMSETPGAYDIPDMVFCNPSTTLDIGTDRFMDWSEVFTEEELSGYVDSFVEEGYVDDRLLVFPVSKSMNILFINSGIFDRFSADTGYTYDDLETWDGFYKTAAAYYDWSGGKIFCSVDYIFNLLHADAISLEEEFISDDNWLNFDCSSFRRGWLRFAKADISGYMKMAEPFSTTDMLCGDAVCGIGSSAAILYFGDNVIYPDNRTEPLNLKVLPVPYEDGSNPSVAQGGAGLAALKSDDDTKLSYADGTVSEAKAEACGIFASWLTEGRRNLDFTAQIGYMPVTNDGLEAISDYDFSSPVQQELQEVMADSVRTRNCYIPDYPPEYNRRIIALYAVTRDAMDEYRRAYLKGGDADELANKSWEALQ